MAGGGDVVCATGLGGGYPDQAASLVGQSKEAQSVAAVFAGGEFRRLAFPVRRWVGMRVPSISTISPAPLGDVRLDRAVRQHSPARQPNSGHGRTAAPNYVEYQGASLRRTHAALLRCPTSSAAVRHQPCHGTRVPVLPPPNALPLARIGALTPFSGGLSQFQSAVALFLSAPSATGLRRPRAPGACDRPVWRCPANGYEARVGDRFVPSPTTLRRRADRATSRRCLPSNRLCCRRGVSADGELPPGRP